MTRNNQKWYDKPISKLILVTIALTWIFPIFGFVLSSFRPGESIKRESWWDAIYTGKLWTELTLANYSEIFFADNLDRSFYNSFAVTIPSTIIPITIAAFAAYAFAFMEFRGKEVLFLFVVGSMIIPLQMSLIPLVQLFKSGIEVFGIPIIPELDLNGTFVATWFAHTGFGLPLATFLLRDFMMGLPKSVIESAKIDGASNMTTFFKLVLPLSVAGIAAFGTFQFLWVYNDFLVANVFLGVYNPENLVVTSHVSQLAVGAYGEAWHLRTSGAIISMIVPLIVFFSLQRFFIRGLIGGAVKG
ncbi:MAG: carbohydrate ABC transporter permease [Actinomycetota bacterium]|jgi:alpha-glucoside transport system permease protein|nr:sugar ABC transporter permease [Actinomycetota bacterium]MEC7892135.1 carbohydrate ABC transporter permease [Actinomycetota bacterium]|tara:strand:- start:509 stop:1411 length:903 start_codon:yes stop_codon:yes gene_type:complete